MELGLYRAEVLAMTAGRMDGNPALIMTMRPESRSFVSYNFAFTQAQAMRIRQELGRLLDDPESWLHVPEDQRTEADEA